MSANRIGVGYRVLVRGRILIRQRVIVRNGFRRNLVIVESLHSSLRLLPETNLGEAKTSLSGGTAGETATGRQGQGIGFISTNGAELSALGGSGVSVLPSPSLGPAICAISL